MYTYLGFVLDDDEGWETVQRPAKGRVRNSPSQRSLENLSGVGKSPAKLQRTYSDPHSAGLRRPPWNHGGGKGRTPPQKNKSSLAESRDSEKENRPQTLSLSKARIDYNKSGSTGTLSKNSYSNSVKKTSKSPPTVPPQENKGEKRSTPETDTTAPIKKEGLVSKAVEEVKAVSPVMEESATEDEEALVIDKVGSRSL